MPGRRHIGRLQSENSWQKSTLGIIGTGALLLEAREELEHDVFNAMRLPFGRRTAQRLMAIAARPIFATHASRLPPSWMTLYVLSGLPDQILLARLDDGTINPAMERREAAALLDRPKKKAVTLKPDLLTAWAAETREGRRVLFDRIPTQELMGLISNAVRAELTELLERQLTAKANASKNLKHDLHGTMSVALLTALSLVELIDQPNSTAIVRKANTYQLLNTLRTHNSMIRAAGGRKEPAIVIVEDGTIETLRNRRTKKRLVA